MDLAPLDVLAALSEKGVSRLYHANSVITTVTFLNQGRLLSRECVEQNNWKQTYQKSDAKDKRLGINNYLFMDMVDIHKQMYGRNLYGPVLLVFDVKLLAHAYIQSIRITKKNPCYWFEGEDDAARYYMTVDEFRASYNKGNLGAMLMFIGQNGSIPLNGNLLGIGLDNPKLKWIRDNTNICDLAMDKLQEAMELSGQVYPIVKRECQRGCNCKAQYQGSRYIYAIKKSETENVFDVE